MFTFYYAGKLQICPLHLWKQVATDDTKPDLNIGDSGVRRLDSGPNIQPSTLVAWVTTGMSHGIWEMVGNLSMVQLFVAGCK